MILTDYKTLKQFITDKKVCNILIFSDTHFHAESDFSLLRRAFDLEPDLAFHAGDLFNGFVKFRDHASTHDEYLEATNQFHNLINNYPRDVGELYFITGNHDLELSKVLRYNIGRAVSRARKNLIYMNNDVQDIRINDCNIRLRHKVSNAGVFQKSSTILSKGLDGKKHVDVLAYAHRHQMSYALVNNIIYLGIPAFSNDLQNDPENGVWLLSIYFDRKNNFEYVSSTYYDADKEKGRKLLKTRSF